MANPIDEVMNWLVLSSSNVPPNLETPRQPVQPSQQYTYDLYNRTEKEALKYGERTWGINLVWGDPSTSDNVRFVRASGQTGPLVSDELIAFGVRNGAGFVKYQVRDTGINLAWSSTPVFEWKLVLPQANQAIQTGTPVGLFNMVEKDFLFYDPRSYGINLKWLRDKGKYNEPWYRSIADVVIGNVPYGDLVRRLSS